MAALLSLLQQQAATEEEENAFVIVVCFLSMSLYTHRSNHLIIQFANQKTYLQRHPKCGLNY